MGQIRELPVWVLSESVEVTLVRDEMYLVARTSGPGAVTLSPSIVGMLVNGRIVRNGEDAAYIIERANALFNPDDPESALPLGYTVGVDQSIPRHRPYDHP